MNKIIGKITIEIESKDFTQEQFDNFEVLSNKAVELFELLVAGIAENCNIEQKNFRTLYLNSLKHN